MNSTTNGFVSALKAWPIWWRLGVRDLSAGFRRSTLGIGWIFVNFGVTILAVGVVYGALLGQNVRSFLPFLASGLLVWTYVTSSIVEGSAAFVASEGYIKQIGISPFIYVFRFFVSLSARMLITLLAFLIVTIMLRGRFHLGALWAVPGILLMCASSLLLIILFAHLNARFRDASHLAALALQSMFFVTPVLWPPELLLGGRLAPIVNFDPLYHLLEIVRQPLLQSRAAWPGNYGAVGLFLLVLGLAAWFATWRLHRKLAYLL